MKKNTLFFLLAINCFFLACQSEKTAKKSSFPKTVDVSNLPKSITYGAEFKTETERITLEIVSLNNFQQQTINSENRLLVEKFCTESKGYQQDIWKGMNDCSWAIEKFKLEQYPELIKRNEDLLTLQLENGETYELKHDTKKNSLTYYQLKDYHPKAKLFTIEVNQTNQCPNYWLINAVDGKKTSLKAYPHLNPSGESLLAISGSNKNKLDCQAHIEFMNLKDGQLDRRWTYEPVGWYPTQVEWTPNGKLFIEQKPLDKQEHMRYAQIVVQEK